MPRISVVMPVYNTKEEYLREAIESILAQTYQDFEFIIVDDGSKSEHVRSTIFSYNDDRIKYLYKENGGVASALNFGWEQAAGEYIARMDSDDVALPERFLKQVEFLDNNPDFSLVGSWFECFPQTEVVKHCEYPTIVSFLQKCAIGHPTVMLRKADFDKYGLKYSLNCRCEDYDLWSRAVRVLKFYNIQEVLLKYRWDGQNLSVEKADEMAKNTKEVQQNILDFLTPDRDLQQKILAIACDNQGKPVCNKLGERFFAIKNIRIEGKKQKLIKFLGQELVLLKRK